MRKNKLFAIFFVLLMVFSFSPFSVIATNEHLNIDTMDVHPINRWTETNTGYTATVADSMLNITDIGDASADGYIIERDLRDTAGTIETHFKYDVNDTFSSVAYAAFQFWDVAGGTGLIAFTMKATVDDYMTTYFSYYDSDGNYKSKSLSGTERIYDNIWYTLRIDYDILQSEMRYRMYFDNGTEVFDYSEFDFSRFDIFSAQSLEYKIVSFLTDDTIQTEFLVDYVKAPFKEREWTNIDDAGAGFLTESAYGCRAEDNVDDWSKWRLTVPYFDSFSGTMYISADSSGGMAAGDNFWMIFTLYAVDADDGDTTEAFQIFYRYEENIAPVVGAGYQWSIEVDAVEKASYLQAIADDTFRGLNLNMYSSEDRSKLFLSVKWGDSDVYYSSWSVDVSDVAADPSQEFVLEVQYNADFDADIEMQGVLTNVDILEKDLWSDVGGMVDDVIGIGQDVVETAVGTGSAIFKWMVSVITDFLAFMVDVLLGGLDALGSLLDSVISTLGSIITELQGLAADIATAVWSGVEVALAFLFDAIEGIWITLVAALNDIIAQLILLAEDVADFLFAAIEFLVVLLLDIVEELWNVIVATIFFVWDTLNLPDVLAVFDLLLVGFGQAIAGFGQFITDINALIGHVFTLSIAGGMFIFFFLPISWSPTIGDWIKNVVSALMFDITFGINLLGFAARVPVGAVWFVIVAGSGILSGSVLGGLF